MKQIKGNKYLLKLAELGIEDIWYINFMDNCKNFSPDYTDIVFDCLLQVDYFSEFILGSFNAAKTPQGWRFWYKIATGFESNAYIIAMNRNNLREDVNNALGTLSAKINCLDNETFNKTILFEFGESHNNKSNYMFIPFNVLKKLKELIWFCNENKESLYFYCETLKLMCVITITGYLEITENQNKLLTLQLWQ